MGEETLDVIPTIHKLKIHHQYIYYIMKGIKTFEIRKNDRNFKIGDQFTLHVVDDDGNYYYDEDYAIFTGEITYICDYEQKPGYVVFAFVPA